MAWTLTVEEWSLLGLLGLSIVLACLGAAMFYGKRPIYPSTMTVRQRARAEQTARYYESRHRSEIADETLLRPWRLPAEAPRGQRLI